MHMLLSQGFLLPCSYNILQARITDKWFPSVLHVLLYQPPWWRQKEEEVDYEQVPVSTVCKIESLKILTQVSGCQLTEACTAPSLFGIPAAITREPSKWELYNQYDLQNGLQDSAKLGASAWGKLESARGFQKRAALGCKGIVSTNQKNC